MPVLVSWTFHIDLISSHLSPLTLEVVGAPQMTLQQYLSILPCLPLPSRNLQTPSIPWCYLPISSSVFLSFLLLSLSLAELLSPCQRILRCGHTIWVFVYLPWLGDHHALQLHSGLHSGFWITIWLKLNVLCFQQIQVTLKFESPKWSDNQTKKKKKHTHTKTLCQEQGQSIQSQVTTKWIGNGRNSNSFQIMPVLHICRIRKILLKLNSLCYRHKHGRFQLSRQ